MRGRARGAGRGSLPVAGRRLAGVGAGALSTRRPAAGGRARSPSAASPSHPTGGGSPHVEGLRARPRCTSPSSRSHGAAPTWLTVNAAGARRHRRGRAARARRDGSPGSADRAAAARSHAGGPYEVVSPMPPSHYEEAVRRAVERIAAGEFEKVVLAREVDVHAPVRARSGRVLGLLREAFTELVRLRRRARRRDVHRRHPRAARAPPGPACLDGRARGLDPP